ncbi:protein N-terminal amidase [Blastomyces parvus]|uniref:Protein N-terminal amidase n=1 Tax=Blastomyces parvus TaxID=2060905 RepID=A0A2B7WYT3_9EURO|nr:protein N-terminal amidase [Blastomyces parvus]
MRIATLQLSPRRGDVEGNIRRANALVDDLEKRLMRLKREAEPDGSGSMAAGSGVCAGTGAGALAGLLDVLVLPEMAFTGYNFPSLEAIRPYLEPTASGPTARWAQSTARRLGCVVCVGYPELAEAGTESDSEITSPATAELPPSSSPLSSAVHAAIRNNIHDEPAKADRPHSNHSDRKENKPVAGVQGPNDDGSMKRTANEESNDNNNDKSSNTTTQSRFNSALLVSPTGSTLYNYQKRFLYYTDEPWAAEGRNGRGFLHLQLPSTTSPDTDPDPDTDSTTTIPTAIGICMDINPYKFLAPWTAYEFATHVLASGARLVLLPMAWLTLLKAEELGEGEEEEKLVLARRPDMETFRYWLLRFWPLVRAVGEGQLQGEAGMVILVFANRVGVEEGGFRIGKDGDGVARYAGSSCVVGIRRVGSGGGSGSGNSSESESESESGSGRGRGPSGGEEAEILVWEMLGRAEEGVCFVDTEAEPKYVFRMREPGGDGDDEDDT